MEASAYVGFVMNNPFQPRPTAATGSSDNATSPSVGFMASSTTKPPQPQVPGASSMSGKFLADETPEKKGWLSRLFGRSKKEDSASKEISAPIEHPKEEAVVKPLSEKELMVKRHEDLLKSVNDICKSLETSRSQKVEVSVVDLVPPLPVENIDALTRTQEAVSGVLEKVSGRLDKVGERDGLVIDSMKKVDLSLASLSKVGERSITSMDGVKGTLGQVNGTMESMHGELKRTGKRYEELCEKVQNSEREHAETMLKLQKRTLLVNAFLGIALIACVIAVIVSAAN